MISMNVFRFLMDTSDKEYEYIEQTYEPPKMILAALMKLEKEILKDMEELNSLIG